MKEAKLCPILLIGFAPPEKGQRDMRRCTKECALYDEEHDCCSIKAVAEDVQYMTGQIDDLLSMSGAFIPYEDDDNFDYDPNTVGRA